MTVASDIAERIRDLRETLGRGEGPLLQEDLARRAGVRASQVSQWERGAQRPSRSRLERWAEREGWPLEMFQEGAPMPSTLLLRMEAPAERTALPESVEGRSPRKILAAFYDVLAAASREGRPCPPELAVLMQAMYDLAVGSPGSARDAEAAGLAAPAGEVAVPGW